MDVGAVRDHLGGKAGAAEDYPFDAQTLVFKVSGKMYALIALDEDPSRITLKCDPEEAEAVRAAFPAVRPGHYMHRAHWNTVTLDGTVPADVLREMMDGSYDLVVRTLRKSEREALQPR